MEELQKIRQKIQQQYPFQPYESQLDLSVDIYNSIVQGIKVSIFESPTGTGKSYALIEGALNYLDDYKANTLIRIKKNENTDNSMPDWFNEPEMKITLNPPKLIQNQQGQNKKHIVLTADEDVYDYSSSDEAKPNIRSCNAQDKIIYCSRTHSQLKQFINEVRRSKHQVKVSTLGSRQHLCINESILQKAHQNINKLNHLCKTNKKNCSYLNGLNVDDQFIQDIYDIDELKEAGLKCKQCPYYAAKELALKVDVICTPYQLLLDSLDLFIEPIIIIDEAHNFGSSLLQTQSTEISLQQLNIVIQGIELYRKKYHQRVKPKTILYLNHISILSKNLIEKIKIKQHLCLISIVDFMIEIGIPKFDIIKLMKFLSDKEMRQRINGFIDNCQHVQFYSSFQCLCKFLSTLFLISQKEAVLYVEKQTCIKLSFINNDSSFQKLLDKSKNLIFLGGTLQPLNEFEIFQDKVDTQQFIFKEYPHIIAQNRCKLMIINAQIEYSQKAKNENESQIMVQTTQILSNIEKQVPQGIVVFMQTYQFLENFKQFIQSSQIKFNKKIYYDEKQNITIFQQYSEQAKEGAILVSVVGGSLSEGINFSDHLARAVVIYGVPYPNLDSVELKEQIQKNGNAYYDNLTMRAVNQCIGRVIRHINDYGMLFLVDKRFSCQKLKSKLSTWLQQRIQIVDEFKETNFFAQLK